MIKNVHSLTSAYRDTNIHPSFRIFEIDAETHVPVNYYQYRLDLDKWNKENTTKDIAWDLAYSALEVKIFPALDFL